jgi:transposase InsO family protein
MFKCSLVFIVEDAKLKAEKWREDYNFGRPYSALNYQAPCVFAEKLNTHDS